MKTELAISNTSRKARRCSRFCLALVPLLSLFISAQVQADLVNGDFELPDLGSSPTFQQLVGVPGWQTTAMDGKIEIWANGFTSSPPGFPIFAYHGKQHAELNATQISTLFQDVNASAAGIINGSILHFGFAHRGRTGVDTMRLTITDLGSDNVFGGGDDSVLFSKNYSTGNLAWAYYTDVGESSIIALGNNLRFAYEAVSTANNNNETGNFIDYASFGLDNAPPGVPEPSAVALLGLAGLGMLVRRRRQA